MANYEDNRIRCSKETAMRLITSPEDAYMDPIDFRKALDMEPQDENVWYVCGDWPVWAEMEDGRYDFGFQCRWYPSLEVIQAFISRYHDAEWWVHFGYADIYHYYWDNGEVI